MRDEDIATRVADRLYELREARGLSLRALAKRSGVTTEMASRAERGIKPPGIQTLLKLCDGLGVELSTFFSFDRRAVTRRGDVNRIARALQLLSPKDRRRAVEGFEIILRAAVTGSGRS
jgi:transcriptional regulator with XRE-family HTH domain